LPYTLWNRVKGYFGRASPILIKVYQIGMKKQQESGGGSSLGEILEKQPEWAVIAPLIRDNKGGYGVKSTS
jgi:hypothetical protein